VAALPAPNERERTQWYFQRYAAHVPVVLPPRAGNPDYHRGPVPKEMYVPAKF
jgi:hypothetical protein